MGLFGPKGQLFELRHIALRQAASIQPACPLQSEEEALVARQQSGAHASTTGNDDNAEHELQTADTLEVSGSLIQVGLLHTAQPLAVMHCACLSAQTPHLPHWRQSCQLDQHACTLKGVCLAGQLASHPGAGPRCVHSTGGKRRVTVRPQPWSSCTAACSQRAGCGVPQWPRAAMGDRAPPAGAGHRPFQVHPDVCEALAPLFSRVTFPGQA